MQWHHGDSSEGTLVDILDTVEREDQRKIHTEGLLLQEQENSIQELNIFCEIVQLVRRLLEGISPFVEVSDQRT